MTIDELIERLQECREHIGRGSAQVYLDIGGKDMLDAVAVKIMPGGINLRAVRIVGAT